jgi:predicted metal-dependent enzyme (double-stranded beta helix superfamily)
MFQLDTFVLDCLDAARDSDGDAVHDVIDRALAERGALTTALGPPTGAGLTVLHNDSDITIIRAVWSPGLEFPPHDHRTWAMIGIFRGQEDNVFYERGTAGIVEAGGRTITAGDVVALGPDVVHRVTNPLAHDHTDAIHVYGGDYVGSTRSAWDPVTLEERPVTFLHSQAVFAGAIEPTVS